MPEILQNGVRETGDHPQMFAPLVELSFRGVGTQIQVAAVVEDELDVRALFDRRLIACGSWRADAQMSNVGP